MALLLGFSTQIWWVTTRGGVWHTGHLIATILTLLLLAEMFGRKRAAPDGPARRRRVPDPGADRVRDAGRRAVADPVVAGRRRPRPDRIGERVAALPWRGWVLLGLGLLPALAFFFWYNLDRFGDPLESGYAMATLPEWLAGAARAGAVLDRRTSR